MKFNKKELEIIATALALEVEEMTNKETQSITQSIISKMQQKNFYGNAEFWVDEK